MSLARIAVQLCTAPGKVLVTLCWRYIAAGRHREFQWRMFTVGRSLCSAFERVGGMLCDVWQESNTATKWVKITVGMGVSQWRYGTVGLLTGVSSLRHTYVRARARTHTHTHTTDRISPKSDTSQNVDRPDPSFEDFVLLGYGAAALDVSTKLSSSEVSSFPPRYSWGVRSSGTIRRRRVVGRLPIFRDNMSHLDR
jgi:hypothetical protein